MAVEMQRLVVEHIKIGQPMTYDVYDIEGKLLLRKGFVVEKFEQIQEIMERGMFVEVDELQKIMDRGGLHAHAAAPPQKFNPFRLWDEIHVKATRLLRNIAHEEDFSEKFMELAGQLETLCSKDADACICVLMRSDTQRYATAHTMNVATVVELVARRMDWSAEQRKVAMCAAMTMNVGMQELYVKLFNQRDPLTPEQKQEIHQHPIKSHALLKAAGVNNEAWLTAVLQHHESPGGQGYPKQLQAVDQMAEMLHLADIFCAKVSPRAYRKPIPANQVAKELFVQEGRGGQNPIPAMIIKEIGIYPPGCFVKLESGETAIVVRRGENANAPVVYSIASGQGTPYVEPQKRDSWRKGYAITGMVPSEKIITRIDIPKLWGY